LNTTDTLVVKDTITIPQVEADTVLSIKSIKEPVFINQGRLEVEIRKIHDTLYVKGECKADTIYKTKKIAVERIKLVKPDRTDVLIAKIPWIASGFIALILLVGFVVFKFTNHKN